MHILQSRCYTTASIACREHDVLVVVVFSVVQQSLDSRLRKDPGTSIGRLFLAPDDGLGIRVAVQVLFELLPWEGEDLLDASDGDVLQTLLGTVLDECGINLTRTKDHSVDLLWFSDCFTVLLVWDDPLELRISSEIFDR